MGSQRWSGFALVLLARGGDAGGVSAACSAGVGPAEPGRVKAEPCPAQSRQRSSARARAKSEHPEVCWALAEV